MAIILTLWIVYSAVLKTSGQWQFQQGSYIDIPDSSHELFIFKILLIAIDLNF